MCACSTERLVIYPPIKTDLFRHFDNEFHVLEKRGNFLRMGPKIDRTIDMHSTDPAINVDNGFRLARAIKHY